MAPVRTVLQGATTPQRSTATARTRTPPSSVRSARGGLTTPGSARSRAGKRSESCAVGKAKDDMVQPVSLFTEGPGTPTQEKREKKSKGDENIIVAVRVRSFNDKELNRKEELAIQMKGETCFLNKNGVENIPFTFDHCFWSIDPSQVATEVPYSEQADIYTYLGEPVLDNALRGFNSSIIAYGQTGSGKSYSIFGPPGSIGSPREGLIPRVCKELFNRLASLTAENPTTTFKIKATMMEVYMEKVHDLLNNRKTIKIRGDLTQGFNIPTFTLQRGLKKLTSSEEEKYKDMAVAVEVKTYKEIADILAKGEDKKTFACTALNERSSRAHTIFELKIQQFSTTKCGVQKTTTSKLTLCDLAGSERCKDAKTLTESKELQFKEACRINTSLLTLGSVVEKVANLKGSSKLVPEFRNSALTKLLMDSIGGNSKTVILTTIAPSATDTHTSHQALRFADRAKSIKTHARINEDSLKEVAQKKQQMEELYKNKFMDLEKEYQLEKQQASLNEESVRLEAECARLQSEKEALERQRIEMARNGLTESEKRRLEIREQDLAKRLAKVQAEFDNAQDKTAELVSRHTDEVQNVRLEKQELDDQVSRLLAELDEERGKYQDALAEWELERDTQRLENKAAISQLTEQHKETLAKQMEAFRKAGAENLTPLVEKVGKLTKESLNKETEWKAKLHERDTAIEELNGKVNTLTAELKEANSKNLVLKSKLNQATAESERAQDQLVTAQEGSKLTSKLYEDLAEKDTHIKDLESTLSDLKTVLQCETTGSDNMQEMLQSLLQSKRAATQERDAAMSKLNLEAKKYGMLQDKNETVLKAEKEKHEAAMKGLKEKIDSLATSGKNAEQEVEAKMEKERAKHFEAVASTQAEMEKKMTLMVTKHVDDIAHLNEQHEISLERASEAHSEAVEVLKKIHEQEKQGLEAANSSIESLLQEIEEKSAKLTAKSRDLKDAEHREEMLVAERDNLNGEVLKAQKLAKTTEETLEGVKKEIRVLKQEQLDEIDNVKRESRRDMDNARRAMEQKNMDSVKKYDEERREMYSRTDKEIEEVKEYEQRRVKMLKQELEDKIEGLEEDKTALTSELNELREKTQLMEVKAEKLQREARQYERLKLDDVEDAKTALEAKYKATVEDLMAKMQTQQKTYTAAMEAEKQKRKKVTQELELAKQKEKNSMQNLISMFQQTQNDFQARLQDEAAKKEEKNDASVSPTTSPRTLNDTLSRSFAELLSKSKPAEEAPMSP